MTKLRAPLSFQRAMDRIADLIDWPVMAEILTTADREVKERTVRDWSDPDTRRAITMEDALKLDVAYRAAGGDGAPLLDCYRVRFDFAAEEATSCERALLMQTAVFAKESGEAVHALAMAALPGASLAVKARALIEAEEAISALTNTLPHLAPAHGGVVSVPGGIDRA